MITGIIASLLLPFVRFTTITLIEQPILYSIKTNSNTVNTVIRTTAETVDWWIIGILIYILGFFILLIRFSLQLLSLKRLFACNPGKKQNKFNLIETKENIAPFSFFNTIVYNSTLHSSSELDMILKHEKIHATQLHTLDLVLIHLLLIIQWVNPLAWLYKKSLEENLEFIADREVIHQIPSKKEYQLTLVKVASNNYSTITNNFYQSLIKKRIVMLNKQTSQSKNLWKTAIILPLLSIFLWSFNTKEIIKVKTTNKIDQEISESIISKKKNEKILEFIINKNSTKKDLSTIKNTLKNEYNVGVKFSNINRNDSNEITSIKVNITSQNSNANYSLKNDTPIRPFMISYNSKTDNVNIGQSNNNIHYTWTDQEDEHKIVEVHTDKNKKHKYVFIGDNDHKKIIKTINKDGKVIIEEIEGEQDSHFDIITDDHKTFAYITGDIDGEPLIFIDNQKSTKEEMKKLDSDLIETINVLKGKQAVKKYGDKAKNGVIKITTKKK